MDHVIEINDLKPKSQRLCRNLSFEESQPFFELADLADAFIKAQREQRTSRPWVQVKSSLQSRLLKETFQSYEQVSTALSIAGIERGWSRVARELGETAEQNKKWLNNLVHRRNQIVHEGDIKRASRPQNLQFNGVSHVEVRRHVARVGFLINAIEVVVRQNP